MLINHKTSLESLWNDGNKYYPDRIKFCIDQRRGKVSIDEEMHIDMENELLDDGSDPRDLFGGDIVFDDPGQLRTHIVWEAHPNIDQNRRRGIGRRRLLSDQGIIDELFSVLTSWIY